MYIQREVENMNELLDKTTIMENMLYKISQDVNAMQYLLEDLEEILLTNCSFSSCVSFLFFSS